MMADFASMAEFQELVASGELGLDSKFLDRYTAARQEWDQKLQPLFDEVRRSESLSREDYAVRINARD